MKTIACFLLALGMTAALKAEPTSGLVAYYTFTGNANDSSGFGHDGTVQGATLTTDRFGNADSAYQFNGNGVISIPSSSDFDYIPANGMTISVWLKLPAYIGTEHLVGRRGGASGNFWQLAFGTGAMDSQHIPLNQWSQVVLTLGANAQGYYVNGILDTATTSVIAAVSDPIAVLIGGSGNFQRFVGSMDNVRIYNRLLSPNEIQDLYHFEVPEPGTLALSAAGLAAFLVRRHRARKLA